MINALKHNGFSQPKALLSTLMYLFFKFTFQIWNISIEQNSKAIKSHEEKKRSLLPLSPVSHFPSQVVTVSRSFLRIHPEIVLNTLNA